MTDLALRKDGACGRITLTRPQALNALSWDMCLRIEAALDRWRTDPQVALVLIEGEGPRAFCAGGDIAEGPVEVVSSLVSRLPPVSGALHPVVFPGCGFTAG
mgnify:CR=1 FL=1